MGTSSAFKSRTQDDHSLDISLRKLLGEICSRLSNQPIETLDLGLAGTLEQLGTLTQASRVFLLKWSSSASELEIMHQWHTEELASLEVNSKNDASVLRGIARTLHGSKTPLLIIDPDTQQRQGLLGVGAFGSVATLGRFVCLGAGPSRSVILCLGFLGDIYSNWSEEIFLSLELIAHILANAVERQQGSRTLLEAEQRFRSFFDLPLVAIAIGSPELRVLDANNKLCDLLGYSREQFLKLGWDELTHPDDRAKEQTEIEQVLSGKSGEYSLDKRCVRKDGSSVHVQTSVVFLRRADGTIDYFIAILEDISSRKLVEAELINQKRYLNQVIDTIPHLVFAKDREGRYTFVNRAFSEELEHPVSDIIGRTDFDLILDQERAASFHTQDQFVFEHRQTLQLPEELFVRKHSQETHWYQTVKRPLFSNDGEIDQVLGVATDLTDRKRAEQALRAILEGTASTTAEDFFHSAVRHIASVLGTKYAFIGKLIEPHNDRIRTLAVWETDHFIANSEYKVDATPTEQIVGKQVRCFPDDACLVFPKDSFLAAHQIRSYMGAPIFDASGRALGILAVMHDRPLEDLPPIRWILTIFAARVGAELERMNMEKTALKLQRQLLQSQKMEAIGQLAAGVAHDLNNALGAVVGHLQLMRLHGQLAPEVEHSVKVALGGCARASSLVEQLLGFSRQGRYNPEVFSLPQLASETVSFLSKVIGHDVELETCGASEDLCVWGDAAQIQQVLTNLILNAKQAMPEGGIITFK